MLAFSITPIFLPLHEKLFNSFQKFHNGRYTLEEYLENNLEIKEQAKEMEKQQIVKAAQDNFYAGQDLAKGYKIDWNSAEQYYNKTFKSEDNGQ